MPITVNGTEYYTMGDAAYAADLFGTSFDIVAGYLDSPNAYHGWAPSDWKSAPGMKLPIWVAGWGSGKAEAESCVSQLKNLGVTNGCAVALDLETTVNPSYVSAFGAIVQHEGYRVWVYGSASTVVRNPSLNGYWVADYIFTPFMYSHPATRATQWTDGAKYDQSTVKMWESENLWK